MYRIEVDDYNNILRVLNTFDDSVGIEITEAEYEKAKLYKKYNPDTRKFSSKLYDESLDEFKESKIKKSKEALSEWLYNNPLFSKVHNKDGEYYSVTQEKQTQLTQMITMATLAAQSGIHFQTTWNSTGTECEPWSIEELTTLSFEMTNYVLPRVKKQQQFELSIKNAKSYKEVEEVEISY